MEDLALDDSDFYFMGNSFDANKKYNKSDPIKQDWESDLDSHGNVLYIPFKQFLEIRGFENLK